MDSKEKKRVLLFPKEPIEKIFAAFVEGFCANFKEGSRIPWGFKALFFSTLRICLPNWRKWDRKWTNKVSQLSRFEVNTLLVGERSRGEWMLGRIWNLFPVQFGVEGLEGFQLPHYWKEIKDPFSPLCQKMELSLANLSFLFPTLAQA